MKKLIGQTFKLVHSGLRGECYNYSDTHVYLRFKDGSTGTYVWKCVEQVTFES